MNVMQTMNAVRTATLAARARTGDNALSLRVESGKAQIVRVVFTASGKSSVVTASAMMPVSDAISALNAMQGGQS
jgi:hypothetical protein